MNEKTSIENLLFSRYCKGENEALGDFFIQEWDKLVFSAYSIVKDKEVAADLLAKVLERLLNIEVSERAEKFENSFTYYKNTIYCILRNLCLDYIKVEANRKEILMERFHLNGTTVKNGVEEIFVFDAFKNCMTELGMQQHKILTLHLEGYKNDEIATKLNISYNTVRNTLTTTRAKLKKLWQHFF